MLDPFGTLDFLNINQENKNNSLIPLIKTSLSLEQYKKEKDKETQNGTSPFTFAYSLRTSAHLINEYFGYQVLLALGMPAPRWKLSKIEASDGACIAFEYIHVKKELYINPDIATDISDSAANKRVHPSLYLGDMAELVINDNDHEQWFHVAMNGTWYRFNYDREETTSRKTEANLILLRINETSQYASADQFLYLAMQFKALAEEKLEKIMNNSRVQHTPEFMAEEGHINTLKKAWKSNAATIYDTIMEKYAKEWQMFDAREKARGEIASKVMQSIVCQESERDIIKEEIMQDLRSKLYYEFDVTSQKVQSEIVQKEIQRRNRLQLSSDREFAKNIVKELEVSSALMSQSIFEEHICQTYLKDKRFSTYRLADRDTIKTLFKKEILSLEVPLFSLENIQRHIELEVKKGDFFKQYPVDKIGCDAIAMELKEKLDKIKQDYPRDSEQAWQAFTKMTNEMSSNLIALGVKQDMEKLTTTPPLKVAPKPSQVQVTTNPSLEVKPTSITPTYPNSTQDPIRENQSSYLQNVVNYFWNPVPVPLANKTIFQFMYHCIDYFNNNSALFDSEGLFRLSGSLKSIDGAIEWITKNPQKNFFEDYKKENPNFFNDVNNIVGLFKKLFKQVVWDDTFQAKAQNMLQRLEKNDSASIRSKVSDLFYNLGKNDDPIQPIILYNLFHLAKLTQEHSELNRMTASSLATILAPMIAPLLGITPKEDERNPDILDQYRTSIANLKKPIEKILETEMLLFSYNMPTKRPSPQDVDALKNASGKRKHFLRSATSAVPPKLPPIPVDGKSRLKQVEPTDKKPPPKP